MVRWSPRLLIVLLGSLAFGSCGSCTCGKKTAEAPRLFPTPQAGFALKTPARTARQTPQGVTQVPTLEPTAVATPPTPLAVNLPEDFPTDLPLYEGSEAFAVQKLAGNAKNVLFHVDAESPEIFQHYRESMQREGWKLTQEYEANYQSFLSFKKGNNLAQMTISTDPRTNKRVVAIMYQEEQELPFNEF